MVRPARGRPRFRSCPPKLTGMTAGSHTFTTLDSELLFESPILGLRRDWVTMPGATVATREVVEHFGAVAVVAVDEAGRVALVHQYRHSVGERLWELPAGLLDVAGEEALRGAERELMEEAGLRAESWSVLVDVISSPGFCDEVVRIYLATGLVAVERPAAEFEEADLGFRWVDLGEARAAVLAGRIVNSIAVAGIFAASEVLSGRGEARAATTEFAWRPTALARRRQQAGVVPDMKRLP